MKLLYKEQLIKSATKYAGSAFWEEVLVKYARDLECEDTDYYGCLFYLSTIKDSDYCGYDTNPRANYYLYHKEFKELYWFYLASDATEWANQQNGYSPDYIPRDHTEYGWSRRSFFEDYRGQQKNNYYWLLPEDIDRLEEILSQPPLLHCLDNGMTFPDTTTCATWLHISGRAKTFHSAKQSLEKHLAGQTATCYKLKFEVR